MSHCQTLIPLEQAFDLARQKPRRKQASENFLKVIRRYWFDFVAFLRDNYHLKHLHQVQRQHAEAYVAHIRAHGRWDRMIHYQAANCPQRAPFTDYEFGGALSSATLNRYQAVCKAVFTALLDDVKMRKNPFAEIFPLPKSAVSREIFTSQELQKIFAAPPPLMRGLFTIGIYTGLRLGDVATLKWSEIDTADTGIFYGTEIHRRTRKTGAVVDIPVVDELADFFTAQRHACMQNEFILPEAAKLYLEHQNVLNRRIHQFLHSLGIATSVAFPGRKRRQSIKDFHSLRHTFCYYAGMRGIPLAVVQRIVGHLSPEMTRHYQAHADRDDRVRAMQKMDHLVEQCRLRHDHDAIRCKLFQYICEAPTEKLDHLWRQLFWAKDHLVSQRK